MGCSLSATCLAVEVKPCSVSEYGKVKANIKTESLLFSGLKENMSVLMSHTDHVSMLPKGFVATRGVRMIASMRPAKTRLKRFTAFNSTRKRS